MAVQERKGRLTDPQDIHGEALTMAIAIVLDRIQTLSKEDRDDLFGLVKDLERAREIPGEEERREECQSIVVTLREILEQAPIRVKRMEQPQGSSQPTPGLQTWIDYVCERIRAFRVEAGMTQEELAERTGLSQSHISRLESKMHSPSRTTIEKIATAISRPVSDFDPSA